MILDPIRRWTLLAFGRSPLTRTADRMQSWAVVAVLVMLVAAVYPALAVGQLGYDAQTGEIAADAASRHSVDATVLDNSKADPSISESVATTFTVDVRWFDQNITHDTVAKVDGPRKAGDHVQVWVNNQGKITTAPMTASDAHLTKIGAVALSWLLIAVAIFGAHALLRFELNRVRDRRWDRGWRELVEDGGGSATFTP